MKKKHINIGLAFAVLIVLLSLAAYVVTTATPASNSGKDFDLARAHADLDYLTSFVEKNRLDHNGAVAVTTACILLPLFDKDRAARLFHVWTTAGLPKFSEDDLNAAIGHALNRTAANNPALFAHIIKSIESDQLSNEGRSRVIVWLCVMTAQKTNAEVWSLRCPALSRLCSISVANVDERNVALKESLACIGDAK